MHYCFTAITRAHDPIFDPADGSYFRLGCWWRIFLKIRGWSPDQLFATHLTVNDAQREMDQDPVMALK